MMPESNWHASIRQLTLDMTLGLKAGSQFVVVGEKDTVILKAILPPSMEDFDHLIAKARKQAAKAGLKRSHIAAAISKARGHK
jgi:hypothetical protein